MYLSTLLSSNITEVPKSESIQFTTDLGTTSLNKILLKHKNVR